METDRTAAIKAARAQLRQYAIDELAEPVRKVLEEGGSRQNLIDLGNIVHKLIEEGYTEHGNE
jgi:predicted flavoprotein YhiN